MKTRRVALVQFDSRPEAVQENLDKMADLTRQAVQREAEWIMFHEGCVCDYTPRLADFAEAIPSGPSTQFMIGLAKEYGRYINFGLSEADGGRYHISQVFVGPEGFVYRYRKTWLWREPDDKGYRNEWARYDPGTGPELFDLDGMRATCFICADGVAPRCIERARDLKPEIVFFPVNRASLEDFEVYGKLAATIGAPMLVTNRIGLSWYKNCMGGSVVYSAGGDVMAKSNRDGIEEILIHDLDIS
jgi:predicted amidohydrolase